MGSSQEPVLGTLLLRRNLRRTEVRRLRRRHHDTISTDGEAGNDQQRGEPDRHLVEVADAEPLHVVFGKRIEIDRRRDPDAERDFWSTVFGQTLPITE